MDNLKNVSFTVIMEQFSGILNVRAVYYQEMINELQWGYKFVRVCKSKHMYNGQLYC